jgi:hypothetical protein
MKVSTVIEIAQVAASLMPTLMSVVTGGAAAFEAVRTALIQHGMTTDAEALVAARAKLVRIHDIAAREAESQY